MSEIQRFYAGENIFVTGGTGFIGKILVEKLLRSCPEIGTIYILIRPKNGVKPEDRIKKFLESSHFILLKKLNSDYKKKVVAINGDATKLGLGMSDADRELIKKKVSIIFHAAATVRFDETLAIAVANNVNSVKEIINMCKECKRLKVGVYVSTAFSHCPLKTIKEELYPAPLTYEESNALIHIIDKQNWSEKEIANFTESIIGKWPNTYTFTKAIAEGIIAEEAKDLPFCIYRPSIALASYKEPLPGWTDNLLGINGVLMGLGLGMIHCMCIDAEATADMVPVDMVCNALIACAWETGTKRMRSGELVPVYNYVSEPENPITWMEIRDVLRSCRNTMGSINMVYYPCGFSTKSYRLFVFFDFFLHYIPAVLVDIILKISGRKPILRKIYEKGHKLMSALLYFVRGQWKFENYRMQSLWKNLNESDKELFHFDMAMCDWKDILCTHGNGMKLHILKEESTPENAKKLRRKLRILFVIHLIVCTSVIVLFLWILWKTICLIWN